MSRGLKIRKYNDNGVNGNQVDYGFPNNGSTNNGFNGNYPGIVGGTDEDSNQIRCNARVVVKGNGTISASTGSKNVTGTLTTFSTDAMIDGNTQILVSNGSGGYTILGVLDTRSSDTALALLANSSTAVSGSAWYYSTEGDSSIIRQKGARRFMVALSTNIQDESIAAGQAYFIADASNTNWAALGADTNAAFGDVFTATKSGRGLSTNGVVWPVATCLLVDDSAPPGQNQMSIAISSDGDTYYASRIKNHFSLNFATPYANANPGDTFIATFFDDSGTIDPATGLPTASTENWC